MNINVIETNVAFIDIHRYCHNRSCKQIRVMSNSSTAIAYINDKVILNPKNAIKLQKKYNKIKIIISSLLHTYQENINLT